MNIYVASSWRNEGQPYVVRVLREHGFTVYDFRNPAPGNGGFHWSEIDPRWQAWSPSQLVDALRHPLAVAGFRTDKAALEKCDTLLLLAPCGRSAHLEAGWAIGHGKDAAVLLADGEPELMYSLFDRAFTSLEEVIRWLKGRE